MILVLLLAACDLSGGDDGADPLACLCDPADTGGDTGGDDTGGDTGGDDTGGGDTGTSGGLF